MRRHDVRGMRVGLRGGMKKLARPLEWNNSLLECYDWAMFIARATLAATLVVGLVAPSAAAAPAPEAPLTGPASKWVNPNWLDPYFLLPAAPLGLMAGYFVVGRPDRALIAPVGFYAAAIAGGIAGHSLGQLGSPSGAGQKALSDFVFGATVGGLGWAGLVLVDQALSPHWGGPLLAPALSVGLAAGMFGVGYNAIGYR
ncbi:MAG: hypothetical protein JWM80_4829 [Cyanobacteria bacterium RYN_339]|nr:hypothetical protein [Cyanobacteria bacterium RYN_339]